MNEAYGKQLDKALAEYRAADTESERERARIRVKACADRIRKESVKADWEVRR
jgi:hypothetical protein